MIVATLGGALGEKQVLFPPALEPIIQLSGYVKRIR